MACLPFSFLFFMTILLMRITTTRAESCETALMTRCGGEGSGPYIMFPFQLREFGSESTRCGYPGFELFCNKYKNQTLITLPKAGDFLVTGINTWDQTVTIADPDDCLPKRLLQRDKMNFTDSPFQWSNAFDLVNLTFFNCSSNNVKKLQRMYHQIIPVLPCVSTPNYSVVYIWPNGPSLSIPEVDISCHVISSALIPSINVQLASSDWPNLYPFMELQWSIPDCRQCYQEQFTACGFSMDTGLQVTCIHEFNSQENGDGEELKGPGVSRKGKLFGISATVGVTGLIILMAYLFSGDGEARGIEHSGTNNVAELPSIVALGGLHSSTIEKYPISEVGESGVLPNPNDTICSICLSEYQPKETLRTIPDCNHYFHAYCIDGWLKINATCPLCRN